MREIALDTETTGLSHAEGDRITEIGCIEIIDKKVTGNSYHVYLNPEREVSARSVEISGLTNEFLRKFNKFEEEYQSFLDFIKDSRLIIHNAPFDVGFLNAELSKVGANLIRSDNVVDTLKMAKEKFPGSPSTLDALCRRFSVDSTKRTKHGALIDAELLAEVYIHMSVELKQNELFKVKNDVTVEVLESPEFVIYKPREFSISQSEYEKHKEFVGNIKNSIWSKVVYDS